MSVPNLNDLACLRSDVLWELLAFLCATENIYVRSMSVSLSRMHTNDELNLPKDIEPTQPYADSY
mgnify:CR=1 FL=1